jgi:ATP/maltotriose-dependent transcriptional regulator MalT
LGGAREARDVGFDREQPEAFAELLLLLANEMMSEEREEDALRIYQRVTSSGEASTSPSLSQASLEGEIAALVALGRRDQADALLEQTTVTDVIGAAAAEGCSARLSLARGRAETGDVAGMVAEFTAILGTCAAPRFLVDNLPVMADLLVEAGADEQALVLLSAARDEAKSPAGRQAAELELGRLGSVEDLVAASAGPDPALAALARVARAEVLARDGRLAEAEPLWAQVVADPSGEPVPKSLALLGLAQLELARGRAEAAQARLAEVRDLSSDEWVLARAAQIEGELAGPSEPTAEPAESLPEVPSAE